jgi:hypothetical protein
MTTTTKEKLPAIGFQITRAEGRTDLCFTSEHTTWADAEERIGNICRTAPKEGGYDKTDFTIWFADGECYKGRYDAAHPLARAYEGTLARHVREELLFASGRKRPGHMTPEQYAQLIAGYSEGAAAFLDTYEIPGA